MHFPDPLAQLLDDGVIEDVVRPLLSGKEAQIYLVRAGGQERVAKIYKEAHHRSFKHRSDYTEGRRVRNTRDQRAMSKRTSYGRSQDEASWRIAEVEFIYRLQAAGVRVPEPHLFADGVLIMELITDANGDPAPRLADAKLTRAQGKQVFQTLLQETVKMLCADVVHGDLSDFNILMSGDGPVVIDFPQAIDAAGNNNAARILKRDVRNLTRFVSRFDRALGHMPYGDEIWDLYETHELTPHTKLQGKRRKSKKTEAKVDALSILDEIAEMERESRERRVAMGLEPVRYARQPKPMLEVTEDESEHPGKTRPKRRRRKRRGQASTQSPTNGPRSNSASGQHGTARPQRPPSKSGSKNASPQRPSNDPGHPQKRPPSSRRSSTRRPQRR